MSQDAEYFASPGSVRVSPAAMEMARDFDRHVRQTGLSGDWLTAFEWIISQSVQHRPDGPWEHLGSGVDLGAFVKREVPQEAIQQVDGLAFAIKIPRSIYELKAERLIDVDETAFTKLILR